MPLYLRDVLANPSLLATGPAPTSMSGDGPDHPMDPELDEHYEKLGAELEKHPIGRAQPAEATGAESKELMDAGWVPDVMGGRTHWLHSEHAAVLGVSTKKALERKRRNDGRAV